MNLHEIKDIIKREGGKIIIVENDKPEVVIMSFDEWRGEKRQERGNAPRTEQPPAQQEPAQTMSSKQVSSSAPPPGEERLGELTIDDLPL
ncbi:MAG: hypothetical protein A3J30_00585 [Candidatus Wildermuthbacteria bacterium RIFCSPLOWO2_02_FULL_47_9c]|uniref:Antitoxin n=2 Tax=Parcubacteria group TaxID=1794811 RepID=A0A837IKT9_9BACT|nr:MAG: hypothetical protein UY25_C0004G0010 [Candidatus Yanofskybacteria bacterium GW2011_GWC1_48_11]KKW04554.1 MAG: hypothetical protein UY38_C0001G0121 [Parcubacteria group bacterium GW2011_GWB1_49_12]KKW09188.1 MAG: hypothetical protein UY45_C0001G0074 [Parcubacteria group bacterium GW2011_GWA1_49_26]KKW14175.1 MAG: hypothetical protein UY53_C0003G0095 [Parcubacteria group bacterium GW2011_GWA2_50_10]OHA61440.1 MAG: hypothetical protein A2109_00990 [Candidatus Wildermuthbacteria bacterium G